MRRTAYASSSQAEKAYTFCAFGIPHCKKRAVQTIILFFHPFAFLFFYDLLIFLIITAFFYDDIYLVDGIFFHKSMSFL